MVKIIVNADDFGLDPVVNSEIAKGLQEGYISSATILANSDYLDDVAQIIEQNPKKSFGVHLNISYGRSITQNPVFNKYGIMGEDGLFIMKAAFKNCPNANPELQKAIEDEWLAQIDLLKNKGIALSHVDGHHHCHTWYGLADALCHVLKETRIQRVRSKFRYPVKKNAKTVCKMVACNVLYPMRSFIYLSNKAKLRTIGDDIYQQDFRTRLQKQGFILPDYFCSFNEFCARYKAGELLLPENCSIELMLHPGVKKYQNENANITVSTIGDLLDDYQLINYWNTNEKE